MPALSEEEQQLLNDLTALDWTRDLDARSVQVISERRGCPAHEAAALLEKFQARKLIDMVSESGGNAAVGRAFDSYRWKWVRTKGHQSVKAV